MGSFALVQKKQSLLSNSLAAMKSQLSARTHPVYFPFPNICFQHKTKQTNKKVILQNKINKLYQPLYYFLFFIVLAFSNCTNNGFYNIFYAYCYSAGHLQSPIIVFCSSTLFSLPLSSCPPFYMCTYIIQLIPFRQ